MNANWFRRLFDYHITTNRRIWDTSVMALTDAQFRQPASYSIGGVCAQTVHMMNIDDRWFAGLRGDAIPGFLNWVHFQNRDKVRAYWDRVESQMRDTLAALTDDRLSQPYPDLDHLSVADALFHVLNHGTDHRAQLLALLFQLGAPTFQQDYFFFASGIDVTAKLAKP